MQEGFFWGCKKSSKFSLDHKVDKIQRWTGSPSVSTLPLLMVVKFSLSSRCSSTDSHYQFTVSWHIPEPPQGWWPASAMPGPLLEKAHPIESIAKVHTCVDGSGIVAGMTQTDLIAAGGAHAKEQRHSDPGGLPSKSNNSPGSHSFPNSTR